VSQIQDYLGNNLQEFRLSGLNRGIYFISIKSNSYIFSAKLICETKSAGTINIEKISNNHAIDQRFLKIETKGTRTPIDMAYTTGDRLKFTGISGNYSTILVDIPTTNKTITFNFIACFDGDNINYPVVSIGTQIWMAENLKTTKYNDGTVIPNITDDATWAAYSSGAYCDYNDTPANSITYGRLYNWFVVDNNPATNVASNGGKNVCPIGWHIPSDPEWSNLTTFLGGESVAGGKLKETGTIHWISPNTSATNETGFTALPGGRRSYYGQFWDIGSNGYWWSSTEKNATGQSWGRDVFYDFAGVYRSSSGSNKDGKSVRCVLN
jgi:uncharacterized protein (TIGR02145 family)